MPHPDEKCALKELLALAADYAPLAAPRYMLQLDGVLAAVLGCRADPTARYGLAASCASIIAYRYTHAIDTLDTKEAWTSWFYRTDRREYKKSDWRELRKIAWAPAPERALIGHWELTNSYLEFLIRFSGDLLWLMLECWRVVGYSWNIPVGCELGLIRHFEPQQLQGMLVDPLKVLPSASGPRKYRFGSEIYGIYAEFPDTINPHPYETFLIAAAARSSAWWSLYIDTVDANSVARYMRERSLGMEYDYTFHKYLLAVTPKQHCGRIISMFVKAGNADCLSCLALEGGHERVLEEMIDMPGQTYEVKYHTLYLIATRELTRGFTNLAIKYLQRCSWERLSYGTDALLMQDPPDAFHISAGTRNAFIRVLDRSTRGGTPFRIKNFKMGPGNTALAIALGNVVKIYRDPSSYVSMVFLGGDALVQGIRWAVEYAVANGIAEEHAATERAVEVVLDWCPRVNRAPMGEAIMLMLAGVDAGAAAEHYYRAVDPPYAVFLASNRRT